jgi:hypothetical protein
MLDIHMIHTAASDTRWLHDIFATFDDNTTYLMGGTGKYKGITGTVRYSEVPLHDTVGGRQAVIVNHKATWQIK